MFRTDRRFRQSLPVGGPTADRPTNVPEGFVYYDTTISKPIWWDGAAWKDSANVAA